MSILINYNKNGGINIIFRLLHNVHTVPAGGVPQNCWFCCRNLLIFIHYNKCQTISEHTPAGIPRGVCPGTVAFPIQLCQIWVIVTKDMSYLINNFKQYMYNTWGVCRKTVGYCKQNIRSRCLSTALVFCQYKCHVNIYWLCMV